MSTHRYKRILFPVLFVKEMTLICPEAPSGCQNPQEFPKGIKPRYEISLLCIFIDRFGPIRLGNGAAIRQNGPG